MRHYLLLILAFVICGVAAVWLWSQRFEKAPAFTMAPLSSLHAVPGHASPAIRDIRTGEISMHAASPGARQVAVFDFPAWEPPHFLHVKITTSARNLIKGPMEWEDGRAFIEWHDPSEKQPPVLRYIHSGSGDFSEESDAFVVRSAFPGAIPRLRVEHLGVDGIYQIQAMEVTPVRETGIWKYGKYALIGIWMLWVAVFARCHKKPAWWRGFLVAVIWMTMAFHFILPGPWEIIRPFGIPFSIRQATSIEQAEFHPSQKIKSGPLHSVAEPFGKISVRGSIVLKVKYHIAKARPLLHGLLLFAPTLAMAWLVGRRKAIILAVLLAAGIETAQCLFGYGFDLLDVLDLIYDAAGIMLGIWAHSRFAARIHRRLPRHFPEPA